jgi:hypothetical protein
MKVKELRELLQDLPDDMEILLQEDSEGNGYHPLRGADDECVYDKDCNEVLSLNCSASENGLDKEDWEELKQEPRVLVLFP